jgi:hypothetical protein
MRIDDGVVHPQGFHAALDLRDRTLTSCGANTVRPANRSGYAGTPRRGVFASSAQAPCPRPAREPARRARSKQQLLVNAQFIHPRNALRADVRELLRASVILQTFPP